MKKVILASVLAAAAMSAQAADVTQVFCSGGTAGSGTAANVNTATDANFVKSAFTPKCSANTHVTGDDGASWYRVGSASVKGKTRYAGGSAGGAVVAAGACSTPTACAAADASAAMTSTYAATS